MQTVLKCQLQSFVPLRQLQGSNFVYNKDHCESFCFQGDWNLLIISGIRIHGIRHCSMTITPGTIPTGPHTSTVLPTSEGALSSNLQSDSSFASSTNSSPTVETIAFETSTSVSSSSYVFIKLFGLVSGIDH